LFLGARLPAPELSASPCRGESPGAGDTFKLREVPKARATNRHAKACRGPVNSLRGVTLHEMLQWMIRSQAPTALGEPRRRFRDLMEVVVVLGRFAKPAPTAKIKSGLVGNFKG
jgi:hypothetical protein